MKILILGTSGMIGSAMLQILSEKKEWDVKGAIRQESSKTLFRSHLAKHLIICSDLSLIDSLEKLIEQVRPNVIINCAGITKHQLNGNDPIALITMNSLLPHNVLKLCKAMGSRLIHISSDCVFSGKKGAYIESDLTDAQDWYGRSKALGEINDSSAITLRTSTIGAELNTQFGLLEWFLSQKNSCKGYSRAYFSGLPAVVFARVICDIVIPKPDLSGLYHVGASCISKLDLLNLIAQIFDKKIDIQVDEQLKIDRSLDCSRFHDATGYLAPSWPELIQEMYEGIGRYKHV